MSRVRVDELQSLETGKVVEVDHIDTSLRADLANPDNPDKGAAMVARGVVVVDSIADLLALPERRSDLRYLVAGSPFKWDSAASTFVPEDTVNAKVFGFSPDATPDANSDAIEAALAFCAGRARLYVEPVEHTISRTIEIPSNTYLFSDGKEHIVFRMDSSVRRGEMVMVTGHRGVHKENIVLRGFGIDANRDRWDIADNNSVYTEMTPTGAYHERNMPALSQTALVICNSSNVLVEELKIIDPYSHCIDVTAPWDGRGQASAVLYDPEPSHDVVVRDIVVAGHGDDGVTTHQSHDVFIDRILSLGASGVKVQTNANAVEIDDGSRHIRVGTVVGRECVHALSIQGHADSPAPYSVTVGTVVAINCHMGVVLTHTGWNSGSSDPEGISGGAGDGISPTARGVTIGNITCIAPRRTEFYGTVMEARGALALSAYENVTIGSVHCVEGNSHLADGIDGILPATPTDASFQRLITTYGGNARGITIDSIHIEGFSASEQGVFLAPRYGGITVGKLVSRNGPKNVFTDASLSGLGGHVHLLSYHVQGNHVGQGTTAILHTGRTGSEIGHGFVEGYDVAVAGPGGSGSGSPYAIVDGSSDVRAAAPGGVTRRLWIGNSVRTSEWLTGLTHNFGSVGGAFAFYATAGGDTDTSSPLMTISTAVRPGRDNTMPLGLSNFRWSEVFSASGTINTSDEREKALQRGLSVVEQDVARELKGMIKAFKWKDAISIKGEEGARWHFGVMAQEVKGVFERHGLDAHDYGMFCYDEWDSVPAVLGENGEIVEPAIEHGNRYGVRYDQLLAFIIAAL